MGNSTQLIPALLKHRIKDKYKLPFICLTNGGGILEGERAELVNKKIGLSQEEYKLQAENIILCHSPFKDEKLVNEYKDKYVLVSGLGNVLDIALKYGYHKAIDIEELYSLYPHTLPTVEIHYSKDRLMKKKRQLLDRFRVSEEEMKRMLKFDAIFLWSDAVLLEMNIQLFSDLLITSDGRLGGEQRRQLDPQAVKFYITNPDVVYADKFNIPRHGQGILLYALESVFQAQYGMQIECIKYGKPELTTYNYTEQYIQKYIKDQTDSNDETVEVSNFYMIGDNPDSDIEGAYRKGWESILVRTGLYQDCSEQKHYAKYVVNDMEQAIKLIYIDGVIYRHKQIVGNSPAVLKKILTPINGVALPFTFVTNGGGFTEDVKAEQVNTRLAIEGITADHMIECHTPLRDREIVDQYRDKYVFVIGCDDTLKVALSYGYSKAISVDEVISLYPQAVPMELNSFPKAYLQEQLENVTKRFNMSAEELQADIKFSAIFHMNYCANLGVAAQIASDILGSKDGHMTGPRRSPSDPQAIKVYNTNLDLVFVNSWPVPRFGPHYFFPTLEYLLKAFYQVGLEYINYGKPELLTYDYAEKHLLERATSQGVQITNFYMIGDNPASDIQGALRKGWKSILVRTGVFSGEENDKTYLADYVVQDFEEAVQLIYKLEGLSY